MARVCQVTKKKPMSGNHVSHSRRKVKRRFLPNLHTKRFWLAEENRWVKLKVSTKAIKMIDQKGLAAVLKEMKESN